MLKARAFKEGPKRADKPAKQACCDDRREEHWT